MSGRALTLSAGVAAAGGAGFVFVAGGFGSAAAVVALDRAVAGAVGAIRFPALTVAMRAITVTGGWFAVTTATLVLIAWCLRVSRLTEAVFSAVVVSTGSLVVGIVKAVCDRARPPADAALIALPITFSFPSGHTMASLCLAAAISLAAWSSGISRSAARAVTVTAAAWAIAVGLSRVYLGVHFASDVLASWLLGAALVSVALGAVSAGADRARPGGR